MKKLVSFVVVIALLAAAGFAAYVAFLRPQPVVWKRELGVIPIPYCPACDKQLNPLAEVCSACGTRVIWEGAEKFKQDVRAAGAAAGEAARQAGDAIGRGAEKAKETFSDTLQRMNEGGRSEP